MCFKRGKFSGRPCERPKPLRELTASEKEAWGFPPDILSVGAADVFPPPIAHRDLPPARKHEEKGET